MEILTKLRNAAAVMLVSLAAVLAVTSIPSTASSLSERRSPATYVTYNGRAFPAVKCDRAPGVYRFIDWAKRRVRRGESFIWLGCGAERGALRYWAAFQMYPAELTGRYLLGQLPPNPSADWILAWDTSQLTAADIPSGYQLNGRYSENGFLLRKNAR